jgi:hypothetical protein
VGAPRPFCSSRKRCAEERRISPVGSLADVTVEDAHALLSGRISRCRAVSVKRGAIDAGACLGSLQPAGGVFDAGETIQHVVVEPPRPTIEVKAGMMANLMSMR